MTELSGEKLKNSLNSKIKLPNVVGNALCNDNISVVWQEHYSHIFNMVNGNNCKELHADLCRHHSVLDPNMIVTSSEIEEIINGLSYNKFLGLDGITSEHMKCASQQLPVLLSILISAILIHGCVPRSMVTSVIVPTIKDKNKSITISEKDNYQPICLSNEFTKVVQILCSRIENFLQTTFNQFGFKPKHGTEMCGFVLKEVIRYYIKLMARVCMWLFWMLPKLLIR